MLDATLGVEELRFVEAILELIIVAIGIAVHYLEALTAQGAVSVEEKDASFIARMSG
jgi:hypothetical protein